VTITEPLRASRAEILRLAQKHGARNVRVFGSAARGGTDAHSDLDLLVDVGERRSPFFPGGLIADLEDLLGCRVEVITEAGLHWYIRDRVVQEAVLL
jgi:hypothetical protein